MEALANVSAAIPRLRQLAGVGASWRDCNEIKNALGDMLVLQVWAAEQPRPCSFWNAVLPNVCPSPADRRALLLTSMLELAPQTT